MLDGPALVEKMGCCLSYGLGKSSPHDLTFLWQDPFSYHGIKARPILSFGLPYVEPRVILSMLKSSRPTCGGLLDCLTLVEEAILPS